MVGARPDYSSHAPLPLPARPREGLGLVGGQEHTWVRPLRARLLRHACADGREGRGDAPRLSAGRPGPPQPVSMGARRPPRVPAPGPRPKVRAQHPGKEGGKAVAERCARSPPSGEGELWSVRHLVSLSLPASSGAYAPPPSQKRRGEDPLLVPPSRPLNSPGACDYCYRPSSTAASHTTKVRTVGGKNKTVAPANRRRRRRFRGLTKMAAAVSAATTCTSTTTAIATAGAARPLARDGNWRLEMRRGSRVSVGRCPKRKASWEV